ncbi:nucleotidyltransferase family protein [Tessaracoccus antarcticus]|uniref:nucleotidyltransferase family protein n=1 Tax=Tessaracoccus antarcticus TaxID=2479848 RepID=UPI001314FE68|nr:sugar phosphate nucleotidyltransferase [Tessaracoccus antarcticus]
MEPPQRGLACLVLAAGLGTRMRPFTDVTPKPLLTVNNEELLARSISQAAAVAARTAVNAFHLAEQIVEFVERSSIHVSREPQLMGTAGAVAQVAHWLEDDDLLILNADTWLAALDEDFVAGWDRTGPRLLVKDVGRASDFGTLRFVGASLLPNELARGLQVKPSGLYEEVWRPRIGSLDLFVTQAMAFDCGTPLEFLQANLAVSGLSAVVHPTSHPGGTVVDSVFLRGATSPPGSVCVGEIRDGFGNLYAAPDPGNIRTPAKAIQRP